MRERLKKREEKNLHAPARKLLCVPLRLARRRSRGEAGGRTQRRQTQRNSSKQRSGRFCYVTSLRIGDRRPPATRGHWAERRRVVGRTRLVSEKRHLFVANCHVRRPLCFPSSTVAKFDRVGLISASTAKRDFRLFRAFP